ncbi:MAG: hypothetical protein AABX23_01285 [Nanoarchaeota archaeon]
MDYRFPTKTESERIFENSGRGTIYFLGILFAVPTAIRSLIEDIRDYRENTEDMMGASRSEKASNLVALISGLAVGGYIFRELYQSIDSRAYEPIIIFQAISLAYETLLRPSIKDDL